MTDLLFLESGALVKERGELLQVSCDALGTEMNADGVVAKEMKELISTGSLSARLKQLLPSRGKGLQAILKGPREELTASSALRLGGYGTLFLELTGQCNERCLHCYADSGPSVDSSLSRETCEGALNDAAELKFQRVQFTGGDPLLSPHLPALVAHAFQLGLRQEVYTNGLSLSEALLDQLLPSRPAFAFSFYSADAATHDAITRVPGSQKRTQRAIVRALKAGLDVRVGVILMESNASHFEDTRDLLQSLGVRSLGWSGTSKVGRGELFRPSLSSPQVSGLHSGAPTEASPTEASPTEAQNTQDKQRRTLRGNLCVSSTGDVFPCIFNRATRLGSVHERSLRNITKDPQVRRSLTLEAQQRLSCYACRVTDAALTRRTST